MSKKHIPEPPLLPLCGCDSHAHLDFADFSDLDAVLLRAKNAGVSHLIQVFLHPDSYEKHKERFAPYPNIYYILGIHPTQANEFTEDIANSMRSLFRQEKRFRGLGEIGLDYYWKEQSKELQQEVFRSQIELAKELDKPIIIHSRDAHEDSISLLLEHSMSGRPLLWHCFGGDRHFAQQLLDHGWHISIPGPVSYKANDDLRDAVRYIPLDRLLIETDCPFLSPVPMRGKCNEPSYLGYTIEVMAQQKNMPVGDLWKICGDNARRFFQITEKESLLQ